MAKIKDINGDGKRNFKDTWLGEKLLGGGKTKGPNLKESMAGARRESSAAPVKSAAPKAKPTTAAKPTAAAKPVATKASSPRPAAKPARPIRSGQTSADTARKSTPVRLGATPATGSKIVASAVTDKRTADAMAKVTESQWKAMTPAERKIRNLPVTGVDGVFSKRSNFKDSKKDLMDIKGADAVTGFRKGGMVSKKGKC